MNKFHFDKKGRRFLIFIPGKFLHPILIFKNYMEKGLRGYVTFEREESTIFLVSNFEILRLNHGQISFR